MILAGYDTKKLVIIHNEHPTPLNSIIKSVNDNEIIIDLSLIDANVTGFHKIVVSEVSALNKPLHRINYYVNSQLHINFDKECYFDNDVGSLSVNYCGEVLLATRVDASIDDFNVPIDDALLTIKVPYIRWRIDDGEWLPVCKQKPIWHEKIHSGSVLEIDNKSNADVEIMIAEENLRQSTHDNNKYLLGLQLIQAMEKNYSIIVIHLKISHKKYTLCKIDYEAELIGEPLIQFNDKVLSVDFSNNFVGPDTALFSLEFEDENGVIPFKSGLVDEIIADNLLDGYYDLRVRLISEKVYESKIQTLRSYENFVVGNIDKFFFDNKSIIVKSTKTEKGRIKFDRHTIDKITYLCEELYPIYHGSLHIPKQKSMPVEIERKGYNSIKIYALSNSVALLNVNVKNKELTSEPHNEKDIFSCSSCYFDVEE